MDENTVAVVLPSKLDVGPAAKAVVDVPRSYMGECGAGSIDDHAAVRCDCVPDTHGMVHVHVRYAWQPGCDTKYTIVVCALVLF
jgi:hypothetical protein